MRRLQVHLNRKSVMMVHRCVLKKRKIVYLLTTAMPVRCRCGRSRIVYIGTTRRGVGRIAGSAAGRAEEIMSARGLKEVNVYVVSCPARAGVPTWKRLEDALLAEFRSEYEQLPMCNSQGKKKRFTKELEHMFKRKAISKVLKQFEAAD